MAKQSNVTCRICFCSKRPSNCLSISPDEQSNGLLEMLIYCIPELDINIVLNPVICRVCKSRLEDAFYFKKQCLRNEEKLLNYSEKHSLGAQIDLELYFSRNFSKRLARGEGNNNVYLSMKKTEYQRNRRYFECKTCLGCEANLKDPTEHTRVHSNTFTCYICSKTVTDTQALLKHVNNHIRRYSCNICGKKLRDRAMGKIHQLSHTGEKPYECGFCGKKYRQKYSLTEHLHKHAGAKAEGNRCRCDICGQTLSTRFNLKIHIKRHTEPPAPDNKPKRRRRRSKKIKKAELEELDIKLEPTVLDGQYEITSEDITHIKQEASCNAVKIKKEFDDDPLKMETMPVEEMPRYNEIKLEAGFEIPVSNDGDLANDEVFKLSKVEDNLVNEVQYYNI